MSNVFTLDAVKEETIRRYSPLSVDIGDGVTVELKSMLRLGEKERKAVAEIIEEISDSDLEDEEDDDAVSEWSESVIDACAKIFKLITKKHKKLLEALDHEDTIIKTNLHMAVLSRWAGDTQLGEAGPSPS